LYRWAYTEIANVHVCGRILSRETECHADAFSRQSWWSDPRLGLTRKFVDIKFEQERDSTASTTTSAEGSCKAHQGGLWGPLSHWDNCIEGEEPEAKHCAAKLQGYGHL